MRCLGARSGKHDPFAFPLRQMFILSLCRICEPIAFMSIFPYIYYMIESFHITSNDKQIALYAGLVTSAFAFAEFSTGVIWGRLSDKLGRKPILLTGLAGTGLSMLVFGFAPNLTTALVARALGGLLNGNIGVLQTTVAEVVTVEAHQARAYAIMPFVWCLGSIVGSALGGALADPVRNYPSLFNEGTIFDKFPYLLPNLVCCAVVIFGLVVGVLFLEETHEDLKERRDYGLGVGNWILDCFRRPGAAAAASTPLSVRKDGHSEETLVLMQHIPDDDLPPDYRSTASSPELSPTRAGPAGLPPPAYHSIVETGRSSGDSQRDGNNDVPAAPSRRSASVANAFTKQVMLNIVGYGILAYHTISAEQLLPVLFSMPASDEKPRLPFKFVGGFALPTKSIGGILSVQGLIQMFATIVVFPMVNRWLGSLMTFRLTVLSYPFLYLVVPYLTLVPVSLRMPCIYLILVWKVTAQAFSFPSTAIMLANSAPSKRVLGTLNGVAASSASLCRAFGPTISGLLQSAGLSVGVLGLPWWANAAIACIGSTISLFMVEERRRSFGGEKQTAEQADDDDDDDDEEAGPVSPPFNANEVNVALVAAESSRASSDLLRPSSSPSSSMTARAANVQDRQARRQSRA